MIMGKVLAIDYGTKDIGLALSDEEKKIALPFLTISPKPNVEKNLDKVFEDVGKLVKTESIEMVVMGMPLTSSGSPTKLGDKVFEFAKNLEAQIGVPVDVMDERMSSKLAARLPHKTARNIHELSAQVILQDYLDSAL